MTIEPFVRCSDVTHSLQFYSGVLDFIVRIPPDPDPTAFMSKYALLERAGDKLHLSAHAGDGEFGNVVYVQVEDIDSLLETFRKRGLVAAEPGGLPTLSMPLTDQSWGMREFSVRDPDNNRITFGQRL